MCYSYAALELSELTQVSHFVSVGIRLLYYLVLTLTFRHVQRNTMPMHFLSTLSMPIVVDSNAHLT